MNDTMHAIRQDELGGTEVLKLIDIPIPAPGIGEIVVRVHGAGVNPVDVMARGTARYSCPGIEILHQRSQSRCTADGVVNVVGNSAVAGCMGGIADMGQGADRAPCFVTVT
jgi:NADPH:quinone reductase-like Zn-dependent oxidoreductase